MSQLEASRDGPLARDLCHALRIGCSDFDHGEVVSIVHPYGGHGPSRHDNHVSFDDHAAESQFKGEFLFLSI